ncbi:MAG: hypothetical protein M3R15_27695 [Acidobacteriota bacterium]|nr:hypothetical protein [Acidobacteriota bacterium]
MSVTEILSEVSKLSSAERQQVVAAIREMEEGAAVEKTDDEKRRALHRRLLAEGAIKNIPTRTVVERDFEPVPIKGKPLSETIIEERR